MTTQDARKTYIRPSQGLPGQSPGTTGHAIPAQRPPADNAPTSQNAEQRTPTTGHMGDRTGVPHGDRAGATSRHACAKPATRLLLVVTEAWQNPPRVKARLAALYLQGWSSAVLVVPDNDDPQVRSAAWEWAHLGGKVERVPDLVAAVPSCDAVLAFIPDLEPTTLGLFDRAQAVGVPAMVDHRGRYPWPAGSVERAEERPFPREELRFRWIAGGGAHPGNAGARQRPSYGGGRW